MKEVKSWEDDSIPTGDHAPPVDPTLTSSVPVRQEKNVGMSEGKPGKVGGFSCRSTATLAVAVSILATVGIGLSVAAILT